MSKFIPDLILDSLDDHGRHFLSLALSSIYGEALFPEEFDADQQIVNLEEFEQKYGETIYSILYPCASEFFFSNEYTNPNPSPKSKPYWNVLDVFFKLNKSKLSVQDLAYWKGMRNSYMSLYEVQAVELDKSITLKDLIDEEKPSIVIKEKKGTHNISQWEILGARIISNAYGSFMAGGVLRLSRKAAEKAMEDIKAISSIMLHPQYLKEMCKDVDNPELLVRKMWAKEIICQWFEEVTKKDQDPILLNNEGDPLQYFTLSYPLIAPKKEVINVLDELKELVCWETEENRYAWIWSYKQPEKASSRNIPENALMMETRIQDDDTGEMHVIYAEIKLKGKKLVVEVNSSQRRNILNNYLSVYLKDKIGEPEIVEHDMTKLKKGKNRKNKKNFFDTGEEGLESLKKFYKSYYQEWLDNPVPALNNQTPREAVKTKEGQKKVINIIKEMQSTKVRINEGEEVYDFNHLFKELNLSPNL